MYFLPTQVAEYDRKRNTAAELRQLSLFVIDEASAIQWVRRELQDKASQLPGPPAYVHARNPELGET